MSFVVWIIQSIVKVVNSVTYEICIAYLLGVNEITHSSESESDMIKATPTVFIVIHC